MDQMTQQNAALVEESAAATEALQAQAKALAEVVSVFKLSPSTALSGHGASAYSAASAAPRPTPAASRPPLAPAISKSAAPVRPSAALPAASAPAAPAAPTAAARPAQPARPAVAAPAKARAKAASTGSDDDWETF
jgi:methyl-accepting chemotaxis protein